MRLSQALEWVAELDFDDMNFSLNSKTVVNVFNDGSLHNAALGGIIQHCRQVLSNSFHNSVVAVNRR